MFGPSFLIPNYPQTVLEESGSHYCRVAPNDPYVIRDGNLITGQNQQSASEYALVLLHALTSDSRLAKAQSAELMASIVAERLIARLEHDGFVIMRRPPAPGGAALGRGFQR